MGIKLKKPISVIAVVFSVFVISLQLHSQDNDSMIVTNNWDNSDYDFDLPAVPYKKAPSRSIRKTSDAIPLHHLNKIISITKKLNFRNDLVIAVARAESSFVPFVISPKGAVGLMQLMKPTARQYGVFNRFNYGENLEAGIKHLKYLYEKYNYNISLTLAAYNAGEGAVSKYNGIPPYPETRKYIKRILNFMNDGSNIKVKSQFVKKTYKIKTKDGKLIISD